MASEGIKTPIEPGLIARVAAGARYALTGKRPEWFGPGDTLAPVAQEEAKGREFDFPFAINTRYTPRQGEAVSFAELRALADSCDVLRLVIETRKDQIERLKWSVAPVDKKAQPDKRCEDLAAFFRMPDRHHSWSQWVRMLLEDLFVIDAPTIYMRQTKGGQFYAAEQIDGATIKRVLDDTGRTPIPPAPAYQQVLKGMPAVDYTADELLYMPRNPRVHKIYGFSPVEQIITTVNIALRRTIHQLQYYTEGNIPEALIGVPQTWNPDQIKQFQMYWDSLLEGNTAQRRHAKFVPGDLKIQMTKEAVLKDGFDEWLARIVCFCFSISPQPFVAQVNRATAETAAEESKLEGLEPIKNWVKNTVDAILLKGFGVADLEFTWTDEKEIDPKAKAEIDKIYVEAKVLTPDEVRADLGRDPLTPEQKEELTPAPPPMLEQQQPPGAAGDEPPPEPGKEALGKAKKSLAPIDRERPAIVRIQNKLEKVVRAFLAAQGKEIAAHITDEFGKMSADDASRMARIIEGLEFDGWAVLAEDMVSLLQAVMTTGAFDALAQVGIQDAGRELVTLVNEQAVAYAKDRAAELVGMKWVDGELVPNPKAEWAITESTREMIRADVVRAMEEGLSNDDLADLIESNYAFSPERAEVIARTETAFADVEGNLTAYRESGLVESKQWIVGAGCCDLCQTLDKKIVPLNEPFPKGKQGPPLHPNCFLPGTKISAIDVSAHYSRRFTGEIVIIRCPGEDDISVTPNHPILTDGGWVKAGRLKMGDKVVKCINPSRLAVFVEPQNNHIESMIEDVPHSLVVPGSMTSRRVPTSAEHFHGDGVTDGEVSIVWPNSSLPFERSILSKLKGNGQFAERHTSFCRYLFDRSCPFAERFERMLCSSDSCVSCRSELCSVLNGGVSHPQGHGFTSIPNVEPHIFPPVSERRTMATDSPANINATLAGHVTLVEIEHVEIAEYDGHVFNLETRDGWYLANGVVAHNCRCDIVPILTEN